MKRRDLLKGAAALPILAQTMLGKTNARPQIIKPERLAPGDTVGVIAPASGVSPETWERATSNLVSLGFKVKVGKNARGRLSFLSATDKERLDDLHWAFGDPEVKAVWCVRGGGGAPRLLPQIDYRLIQKNPKVFIGFSDITALHLAIHQRTGLVTFHGPVASSELSDYTRKHVTSVLMDPQPTHAVEISEFNAAKESAMFRTEVIRKGKCTGRLTGGNLALLTSLAGTPFALSNIKGSILFIEDVNEPPYRVDRMLTQLRQSCDLRSVAGIALGIFDEGGTTPAKTSQPLMDVFRDRLGDLGVPVVYGLSFGHIRDLFTLPYGIRAELDADRASLTFLESAVL